jgi:hypothetical protein
MQRSILSFCCISLFILTGCASSQYKAIQEQESSKTNSAVRFEMGETKYFAVVDKHGALLRVCDSWCAYNRVIGEEILGISKTAIGLAGFRNKEIRCGNLLATLGDKKSDDCDSKYYSVSSIEPIPRTLLLGLGAALYGPVGAGVGLIFPWTAHNEEFDINTLRATVSSAHLTALQTMLYSPDFQGKKLGRINVVSVDLSDIQGSIEKLNDTHVEIDGALLVDADSSIPMSIIHFDDYKDRTMAEAVSQQLNTLISYQKAASLVLNESDFLRMIPEEVAVPVLPPSPKPVKSEYETTTEFAKRVKASVADWDAANNEFRRQYRQNVEERNQYIKQLGAAKIRYSEDEQAKKLEFDKKLENRKLQLAQFLYVLDYGKFTAFEMSYDADGNKFYFTSASERFGFNQKMVVDNIRASSAQQIKNGEKYSIRPDLQVKNKVVTLVGINLITENNDRYSASYTDINYHPDIVTVRQMSAPPVEKLTAVSFDSYLQKPKVIPAQKSYNIAFNNEVARQNARSPDWYSSQDFTDGKLAYGKGNSYEEALSAARADLAQSKSVSIEASTDILQKDNTVSSFAEVKNRTKTSSKETLSADEYSIVAQKEVDGVFYVKLILKD